MQRLHPFYFFKGGHDEVQGGNEDFLNAGLRFNFTRQGFLNVTASTGHETWRGQRFKVGSDISIFGTMQAFRWLSVYSSINRGNAIYYDDVDPFQGRTNSGSVGFTVQPNQQFTESVEVNVVRFNRASTGARVYSVDIINSRMTYQFDKHFLVRLIAQYDSSVRRVLTDLLGSYELVPGTVFHAGYGSLYERGRFEAVPPDSNASVTLDEKYRMVNRGLFFKASYLRRF